MLVGCGLLKVFVIVDCDFSKSFPAVLAKLRELEREGNDRDCAVRRDNRRILQGRHTKARGRTNPLKMEPLLIERRQYVILSKGLPSDVCMVFLGFTS